MHLTESGAETVEQLVRRGFARVFAALGNENDVIFMPKVNPAPMIALAPFTVRGATPVAAIVKHLLDLPRGHLGRRAVSERGHDVAGSLPLPRRWGTPGSASKEQ